MATNPEWLSSIYDPGMYPHPVSNIQLMETHISWIILTGDWVYKLKKPVNFGFVDFSTLELRQAACHEEIRLNRRTAPLIYDAVVALADDADCPQFGATGPVIEYAVRLRQFQQEHLLERCLARQELTTEDIDSLACAVADLHRQAAVAPIASKFGTPAAIRSAVDKCLEHLGDESLPAPLRSQVEPLAEWTRSEWTRLTVTFVRRRQAGLVRECHGDLHLGNLVRYQGQPTLFDCLEFNPDLRWIDVMSDVAFLVMDLCDKAAEPLAWRFLNRWLEQIGDYDGLNVLRYYMAYRALVRAKVAALRLGQEGLEPTEAKHQRELLVSYVELALKLSHTGPKALILMHGVSGSGKTFIARQLASWLGAIQVRSDVERKRVRTPDSDSADDQNRYSEKSMQETYEQLQSIARLVINSGFPVIIDATFSKQSYREEFSRLADELHVPFQIVSCEAPLEVLRERVIRRQEAKCDVSEADTQVLEHQLSTFVPLSEREQKQTIFIDTTASDVAEVAQAIRLKMIEA